MALLPFKNPQSPLNRSRSSSCSSPVRNRIVYQEVYSIGANTLVRSYSCDKVFDKDENGRTFQTTQIHVSSFITPEKNIHIKSDEKKLKGTRRLLVKLPADKPEISKTNKIKPSEHKDFIKRAFGRIMLFSFLSITSACALYFYLSYKECTYVWDLERTEFELDMNIFGQDQAVGRIKSVLKKCNSTNDAHIMVFTGGVGVGKTYSSSIIRRNFPWSSNKLIPYSESFTEDVENLINQKLSTCGCNLIIVDDLSVKSVKDAIDLIALLHNKRKSYENLLLILIFQMQNATDGKEIRSKLDNTFFNINHISFQPLTKEDVEKCFRLEIQRQNIMISNSELRKLVDEKMKHIEVVKGSPGCKGVDVEVASYFKKKLE